MSDVRAEDAAPQHRRGAGVSFVYDSLKREIIELRLAPGAPVDEVLLSERFSLSRTPIREALVRLAAEGLVTALSNRATVVAPIDFLNLSSFFDALTLMNRVTTRGAAARRGDDRLGRIEAEQQNFTAAVEARDALAMIARNRDFHVEIARAAGNRYYTDLYTQLLDEGRRILRVYYSSFNDILPRQYVAEHDDMIAAIRAGDVERADWLATAHSDQIVRQIQSYIAADSRLSHRIALP